jgi:integrase
MTRPKRPIAEINRLVYRRGIRYYIDLRRYGLGRIALQPDGETRATMDTDEAVRLGLVMLEQAQADAAALRDSRVGRHLTIGIVARSWESTLLRDVAEERLSDTTRVRYLLALRQLLGTTNEHGDPHTPALDQDLPIYRLHTRHVRAALATLRSRTGRQGPLSPTSLNHCVVVISLLVKHAITLEAMPPHADPVGGLGKSERPPARRSDRTDFLEVPEVAVLLETLRARPVGAVPYALIAALLLYTGCRLSEVLGLTVSDVNFERKTVRIARNAFRRLKHGGDRTIPLWPELEVILAAHLTATGLTSGLLLPARRADGTVGMHRAKYTALFAEAQRVAAASLSAMEQAAFLEKHVTAKVFRTTYCAARLQTLDAGAPVSVEVVRRELGHTSLAMILRVYSRIGRVRVRGEAVSYFGPTGQGVIATHET